MIPGEDSFADLVAAIGADAATLLARRFGGTTLYVPRTVGPHHPLSALLGEERATELAAWGGGSRINVAKQPERRARVRELRKRTSLTVVEIAIATGYSERHVYRLLSGPDDRQLGLFDGQP